MAGTVIATGYLDSAILFLAPLTSWLKREYLSMSVVADRVDF